MSEPRQPCKTCPWRLDSHSKDIPGFQLEFAEELDQTSRQPDGSEAPFGAPLFACHQSKPDQEIICAGWQAVEGYNNLTARVSAFQGRLDLRGFRPGPDWPPLLGSFQEMIEKLRRQEEER